MAVVRTLPNKPPETKIVYQNVESVGALLGAKGKPVLRKVLGLIRDAAYYRNWPLVRLEIAHVEDKEIENWRYVLIVLVFSRDFEAADGYLHNFYERLDSLAQVLDSEEQDILRRKLFFDIAAAV